MISTSILLTSSLLFVSTTTTARPPKHGVKQDTKSGQPEDNKRTPKDQASSRTVFLSHTRQANETTGIHHTNFRVPQHENFPMIENDADSRHSFPDPVFIISDSLLVGKRTQTKERQ
jgi:BRCT domain type II-containing protein